MVDKIKDVLHHYHIDAIGGHSGVNATLEWCIKEDIDEYISF